MPDNFLFVLADATLQTLYMVIAAAGISAVVGLPLGAFLATSSKGGLFAAPRLNGLLEMSVDLMSSTPFIILAMAIIPLARLVMGTSAGTSAAIVPLAIVATSFVAKTVKGAIRGVDQGLVEASRAMGATPLQIVLKVLLPEAREAIVLGFTVGLVSLVGNAAIVGAVGGGGLGDLGIRFGYQSFTPEIMAAIIVVLIVLVQVIQLFGSRLASSAVRRRDGNIHLLSSRGRVSYPRRLAPHARA
jgi:D-methionine transport system permease protein